MKAKIILIVLIILILIFFQPIVVATKVLLLISEQFPQIPLKPLSLLTNQPKHEQIKFANGIIADLYIPTYLRLPWVAQEKAAALILAMGVRTNEKDKPILLGFANTLARLGYVVVWPRLKNLDMDRIKYERPQTFLSSFQYLQKRPEVDKNRVSFIGFSVGSSIAMVAAENPSINSKVHSFIFFGGYFNIFDYLKALATKSMVLDGQDVSWNPAQGAVNHAKEILKKEGLKLKEFQFAILTKHPMLLQLSPDQNLSNFKAPIFILHEKADNYVPYVESIKLKQALEGKVPVIFHLANLFEHVQPKKGISLEQIREFATLYGFLYKVFLAL